MRGSIIRFFLGLEACLVAVLLVLIAYEATSESAVGPHIGDHWHATYEVTICGTLLPPFAFWEGGIHTHDDWIIHSHPHIPEEEGRGATLAKWVEYGGGELTTESITLPDNGPTFTNGEVCIGDDTPATLRVTVNDDPLRRWTNYIPQHQDHIEITFGP